jgi:hypothetical protein
MRADEDVDASEDFMSEFLDLHEEWAVLTQ